jgi:hypothetical protein
MFAISFVIHWIKSAAEKIDLMKSDTLKNKVPLVELDELFSYIKKKQIKSEYGLLLIETGYVLLDLRSVTLVLKHSEDFGPK